MVRFRYKAVNTAGGLLEGEIEALTELDALQRLKAQGHAPISAEPVGGDRWRQARRLPAGIGRRRRFDVGAFVRDTGTLLEAGTSLDRALSMNVELATGPRQADVLQAMLDGVRNGRALSEVMQEQSGTFSQFQVNMVRAGEASGALGRVLLQLGESIERLEAVKDSIRTALIYPALLVVITVLSLGVLMVVVVPQFAVLFQDMGRALPWPTRLVSGAGEVLRGYWWLGLALFGGALILVERRWRDEAARYRWESRALRWPLIGDLMIKTQMAIFSRTLATLLANGVPLMSALRIVRDTLANRVLRESVAGVAEGVKEGRTLAAQMMDSGWFPPLVIHLVRVGEESGALDGMLFRLADIYDREVRASVQRMLALLEPMLIIGLGIVVGGIIMSILVAILSINDLTL